MTEYFRIEGKNLIDFDRQMVSGTAPVYCLGDRRPPREMSNPLTRAEVVMHLPRLPLGIRGHALNRGMSMVSFPFDIQAGTDPAMEQALHEFKETLNEGQLHIESEDARGTQAVLHYKSDNAIQHSYKTIYYGHMAEAGARDVLGAKAKVSYLQNVELTLYMEPMWRTETAIGLGPNEVYCPGFEEDGDANGLADNWTNIGATLSMDSTVVLQGFYSQEVVTDAAWQGMQNAVMVAPAVTTDAVAYVWVCRPAAGADIQVQLWDATAAVARDAQSLSTGGWETATAKDGVNVFSRIVVSSNAIVPGNNHNLIVYSTGAAATTFYLDKAFWKWGTTTAPDEWCDHPLLYNHYDTTEGVAHVGHQNYFDVSDLKGTNEARLLVRVQHAFVADLAYHADLIAARRSWWDYPELDVVRDMHWLEAENADTQTNWADGVLARCSAGNMVTDAANAAGSVEWDFFNPDAAGPLKRSNSIRGRWDVFGVVYTDDEANTEYRLSHTNLGATRTFYNAWVRQTLPDQWQLVYLGEINLGRHLRDSQPAHDCSVTVEYVKDAADTVQLDCIWLLPKSEPETKLHVPDDDWGYYVNDLWVFSRDEDFDYQAKEEFGVADYMTKGELYLQGDGFSLMPRRIVGQRLYMSIESVDTVPAPDERVWEAHGAGTLRLRVDISYLPQYQTPLD